MSVFYPPLPPMVQQPLVVQGLLLIEASRPHTHSETQQSVGLLWTSDRPVAETSTLQHTTITKHRTSMPPAGYEPAILETELSQTHAIYRAANGIGRNRGIAPVFPRN